MIIRSVELEHFRNYDKLDISFDEGTNIFYGDNAQGKTNILEALYMSGTTKSHRGSHDKEMIQFDEEEAHIRTKVEKGSVLYQIDMHLRKNRTKGIAINGVPIRKASELYGIMNFVFFSPEDLSIIKLGPVGRRRFIDMELCQLDKVYLHDLAQYNKIVVQRNKLLKDIPFQPSLEDTLDIWDEQLALFGTKIIRARKKFVMQLNEIITDIHLHLSGGKENLHVFYEMDTTEEEIFRNIKSARERDKKLKTTTVGPHRDDLMFEAEGIDLRVYGSQGQQRTAALSLKLSEIELVKQVTGDTPVLLLDDVLSELDKNRQTYLLEKIHDIQTMVTCTGLDEFVNSRFSVNKTFHVESGRILNNN